MTSQAAPVADPSIFQAMADSIPQLAWIADGLGFIQWYNRRWYDYTGTTLEQMEGWGWRSVHHPDHVDRVVEKFSDALSSGTVWEDTFPLRAKDGTYRWFLSRAEPIRDSGGNLVRWFGTNTDITEQRETEHAARLAAERVRLALDAGAIIGTWFWDLPKDSFIIDEQFARSFGVDPAIIHESLNLERVIATVHPDDKPELMEAIARAIARGGPYAHQYRVRRADGRYYWIEANGRVDHGPDGTPLSFPGVLLDVEERRSMEQAVRETSRRLNAILANTRMAVFLMDERQYCVFANKAAEELTGYSFEEMQGRPLHDVVHHKKPDGSHYPLEECPIDRAFPERAQMDGEELFVAPDGSFYPVAFTASPVLDEDGMPIGTVIEARNIAEEKARDTALRQSEELFRTLLNAIPQMVWSTRPDGHHDFYNDRWYEFTGTPPGSNDGEGWNGMFHPDDQGRAIAQWRQCLQTGDPYEIEYRLRHRSGNYRWVLGRALPVRDEQGAITRWMGTCTDIEDLKRTGTKLQEAMRAQEALLYEVNHRVKNSLQVVMSLLALQSNRAADPQVQQSLSDARSRIGVIASIHQSLYQTGTHGEIELCDYLRSLTNQTLAVHGNLQTIGLRSDCEDRILLPISQAVPIALIVSELLTNAIKHAFEGPGGELHLRVHRHGSDLLIAIGDNGRGLPSDFDVQKSSGVGMRVVTALAKQLRGKLEIDSSNAGASFTIVVPLEA